MYMPFSLRCRHCNHINLPDRKPSVSILMVLSGQFDTCRNCGIEFEQITVPSRPLVLKVLRELDRAKAPRVHIKPYKKRVGRCPKAFGI